MYSKKKFRRMILAAIFMGGFIFSPQVDNILNIPAAYAEIKTYTGVGKGTQSELVTAAKAKEYAKIRAEIDAKDKAGVYLRGYTKMQNFNLTENKIEVITNSIVNFVGEVKYTQKPFDLDGVPAVVYTATIQANIDTDGINTYINRNSGEKAQSELQSARKQILENLDKIDNLIERYNRATTQAEKDKIRAELSDADKKVLAGQKNDAGNEFYYKGEYQTAINLYNEALQLNQNYAYAYNNRGNAYQNLKQYEVAISDYNKAIKLNPNYADAYSNRGAAYNDLKQYDAAISDCNKAIEINPNYANAYNNRGNAYNNLNQYDKAISDFNKAIQLNPNDAYAYNNRGITYYDLEQYEKAIADYSKAIEINPNYADAYKNRSIACALSGNFQQAIKDATTAIKLNPNYANAYYVRGLCYQKLGETEKANADFAKAKELGYNG